MITRTLPLWQGRDWQQSLRDAVRDPAELCRLLELDPGLIEPARAAARAFALRVPREFVARMRKGDPGDPLLRQVLPLDEELGSLPGFSADPLAEGSCNPAPGLIHKYHGRVLLIVSGACAVNCRYCFRRHFPYADNAPGRARWSQTLDYVARRSEVTEVILSGGDPLAASDALLAWLVERIAEIPHVRRLRVHTRLPIVIPDRVTPACLDWLTGSRLRTALVLHSNHAQELDATVEAALHRLRERAVPLFNQSVLLRGVNDSVDALAELSERLFDCGVTPYYLHLLDPVDGAAHFGVDEDRARRLHDAIRRRLPGYLVPRLARETAGGPYKLLLAGG